MRRLVICADGAWNRPDERTDGIETPTNVMKMARARLRHDATAALPNRYVPGNLITYLTRTSAEPLVAASLPEQLPTSGEPLRSMRGRES